MSLKHPALPYIAPFAAYLFFLAIRAYLPFEYFVRVLAGITYNLWMIRSGSLGDCILAHAVTNGCLAAYIVAAGQWQDWLYKQRQPLGTRILLSKLSAFQLRAVTAGRKRVLNGYVVFAKSKKM